MKGAKDMLAVAAMSECGECEKKRDDRRRVLTDASCIPEELHQAHTIVPLHYIASMCRAISPYKCAPESSRSRRISNYLGVMQRMYRCTQKIVNYHRKPWSKKCESGCVGMTKIQAT